MKLINTEQKMILSHIMSRRRRGIDEAHNQEGRYLTMYLVRIVDVVVGATRWSQ